MKVDWLIVGAGFTGATLAERIASQLQKKVLVVERRDHIAGNTYDHCDEHGILVHKYGPHIFHTNIKRVWEYLSRFTEWRRFSHRVLAVVDGKRIPVPFNLNSLRAVFPPKKARKLETLLLEHYEFGEQVPILALKESSISELRALGEYIYEKVFHEYSLKQWGMKPEELSPAVTGRIPVRISRDDRYFHDTHQAMPTHGYTAMIQKMLTHPKIEVMLNTEYRDIVGSIEFDGMMYTGPIDEFLGNIYGPLPYRSLRFDFVHADVEFYQEVAVVNYPNENTYTRITEFKHMTGQQSPTTTVAFEYPLCYVPEENEPYYPIPKQEYEEQYRRYHQDARRIRPNVLLAGRLADYKYYDIDQAVERALSLFEKEVAR
jgi:UDP-galactopyranose mutase